ncbi:MAG: hypothetical protein IPO95_08705 [Rhodanobacteraceae bacterium]|nr:hypothetical protein [Rhodanobacteraceae bacterium]
MNAERAAEEARGLVRWLRPECRRHGTPRNRRDTGADDGDGTETATAAVTAPAKPAPWPKDTIEQVRAVAELMAAATPLSLDDIAARFSGRGAWKKRLPPLLAMLVALGRAHQDGTRFSRGGS